MKFRCDCNYILLGQKVYCIDCLHNIWLNLWEKYDTLYVDFGSTKTGSDILAKTKLWHFSSVFSRACRCSNRSSLDTQIILFKACLTLTLVEFFPWLLTRLADPHLSMSSVICESFSKITSMASSSFGSFNSFAVLLGEWFVIFVLYLCFLHILEVKDCLRRT